jgi:hypothetical protein
MTARPSLADNRKVIIVIGIVIASTLAFGLVLGYVHLAAWAREARTTRFVFEDRDTYLFVKLDRPLASDESALVSMRALREALRLKLAGVGYKRVLVDASALRMANMRAFWLLIGALAPALGSETVKWAVVCGKRTQAAKRFRESGVLTPFPSAREGERYLRSAEPRQGVLLDAEQLDGLLVPRSRKVA